MYFRFFVYFIEFTIRIRIRFVSFLFIWDFFCCVFFTPLPFPIKSPTWKSALNIYNIYIYTTKLISLLLQFYYFTIYFFLPDIYIRFFLFVLLRWWFSLSLSFCHMVTTDDFDNNERKSSSYKTTTTKRLSSGSIFVFVVFSLSLSLFFF